MNRQRRAQAVVEVLALAPLVSACVVAFAIASSRIVAHVQAQSALQAALAADAAGEPIQAALRGRALLVHLDTEQIIVEVDAPWRAVRVTSNRPN